MLTNRHVVKSDEKELERLQTELRNRKTDLENEARAIATARQIFLRTCQACDQETYDEEIGQFEKTNIRAGDELLAAQMRLDLIRFNDDYSIELVDGRKIKARLVKVSEDHDLAYLLSDLNDCPHLEMQYESLIHSGEKVFAIGSPLDSAYSADSGRSFRLKAATHSA